MAGSSRIARRAGIKHAANAAAVSSAAGRSQADCESDPNQQRAVAGYSSQHSTGIGAQG
jgi:hypothetical protein